MARTANRGTISAIPLLHTIQCAGDWANISGSRKKIYSVAVMKATALSISGDFWNNTINHTWMSSMMALNKMFMWMIQLYLD